MYPSYFAGILNRMPNIHLYAVCSEKINALFQNSVTLSAYIFKKEWLKYRLNKES